MIKLDLKDRRILYQLDLDSRQSLQTIGKRVGLPKNVVAYRIKRLEELGIIKNFYSVIDASKLGYISLRFYLIFQDMNPKMEKKIIDYFVNNKHTYWIGSIQGLFDLVVITWVKDINDFYSFWEETLKRYRNYFQEQLLSLYVKLYHYRYSYLLEEKTERTKFEITGGGEKIGIDKTDFKILKLIASNARITITEIAKKLDYNVATINFRIKNLIKSGVIQGFRVNIDFTKLGYQHFKVNIYLKDYKKVDAITDYIKLNPNLVYIDKSVGFSDIELEFHFKSLNEFKRTIDSLVIKFPKTIKNYKYFIISTIHKLNYMPEE